MPTKLRTHENLEIEKLTKKLSTLIGAEVKIKKRSNSFSLMFNVSREKEDMYLINGCSSRQEFIEKLKIAINALVIQHACWLDNPTDCIEEYYKNRV